MTTAQKVLAHAVAQPALFGGGRLICIDGPAGSGKTSLAAALVATAHSRFGSVQVLHMDAMYAGWSGLGDVAQRLADSVIGPLAAGRTGRYRRFDWDAMRFAEERDVEPVDLLVVEGVGSGSPLFAEWRSTLVWVSAPESLRLERGLARDGKDLRDKWLAWMADETRVFDRDGTAQAADFHVDELGRLVAP